jgi:ATP/ADP translocase
VIGGSAWEGSPAVFRSPYLLAISAYVLIVAAMATFVYFTRLQMVAALGTNLDMRTATFVQRGIMRPARETLFTIVPRADRYKSKAFIDTFVYPGG